MTRQNSNRGKTHEEIYGIEKSRELKANLSAKKKGKTLGEIYGDKADSVRQSLFRAAEKTGSSRRGKSFEEIWGDRAEGIRKKVSETNKAFGPRSWARLHVSIPKGTTYEEWYGEKAQEEVDKRSGRRAGLSRFGSGKYIDWRAQVLERDKYSCLDCGTMNPSNHVHHTVPWKENEELRFEVSNGETLCNSCHGRRKVH